MDEIALADPILADDYCPWLKRDLQKSARFREIFLIVTLLIRTPSESRAIVN